MAPTNQQLGGNQTDEAEFENKVVLTLISIFGLIIVEGLFLAGSGFLSDDWSDFGSNIVYPLFSPTVGVFFLGSAAYGVWKTRGQKEASD